MKHCYSCAMPLEETSERKYCEFCADEKGNLRSKEDSIKGISQWLSTWGPKLSEEEYEKRAINYLKSMPEWAEKF